MRLIQLNLLGTTAIRKKRKKIRFYITFAYICVWLFSIYTLFYIYKTNLFISTVYQKEIQKIHTDIASLRPKFANIDKLYQEKKAIEAKKSLYRQDFYRPGSWLDKMMALSRKIPENIRLEELSVNTKPDKGKGKEKIKLVGYTLIDREQQDVTQLNVFKRFLEDDGRFMEGLEKIEVLQGRIGKKGKDPVMTFVLGVY